MTCEKIFSIVNTYVNGIMYHTEMVQYFDFSNLHGYKRMHEYHRKCESNSSRKLHGYYEPIPKAAPRDRRIREIGYT